MQRYGSIIQIKPERFEEYKAAHTAVWPEVLDMIRECNIQNYSIYFKDGYLFTILNISEMIMSPIWPKWPPIPSHSNGGIT